jgi:hypothetical protein
MSKSSDKTWPHCQYIESLSGLEQTPNYCDRVATHEHEGKHYCAEHHYRHITITVDEDEYSCDDDGM